MKRHRLALAVVATAAIWAGGQCRGPQMGPPPTSLPSLTGSPTPSWAEEQVCVPGGPMESQAKEALSRLLSPPVEEVEMLRVEAVEWPDASLGCPEPGTFYAEVVVQGCRVVMMVGNQTFEYHSGGGHGVLCDQQAHPISLSPFPTGTTIAAPSTPTPTGEYGADVCAMMLMVPHGKACPRPPMPDD